MQETSKREQGLEVLMFSLKGRTPLLMNSPQQTLSQSVKSGKLGQKKEYLPEHEAEIRTYRDFNGDLVVPAIAVRSCILAAASGFKVGKQSAMRMIGGALIIKDPFFPLVDDNDEPIHTYSEINQQRVVIGRDGVIRCRPQINDWNLTGWFTYISRYMPNVDIIADALTLGGTSIGLLDFRPQRKGWFGTFSLERIWIAKEN